MTDSRHKAFWRKPLFHVLLLVALGLIIYSNTLNVPFVFDDEVTIEQNHAIRDISIIPSLIAGAQGTFASRPLLQSTLAINYYFGELNPWGYHAINLFLHILNGVLLYLLITATGKAKGYPSNETALTALITSLIFIIHPAQTEAVICVTNRSILFATTFFLLGMLLFLKAVTGEKRKTLYAVALCVASLLGMASREDFAMFPLILILFDLLFISGLSPKKVARHYRIYLPVFLSLGYLAHLVHSNSYDKSVDYPHLAIPPIDYILTQFKVHWTYLRLLVLPINQSIDYDYSVSRSLFNPKTAASLLGYAGLWAAGVLFARKRPALSFPVLWFLITLLPIAFAVAFVPGLKLDDVIFEHRLYLPATMLFLLPGALLSTLLVRLNNGKQKSALIVTLLILCLSLSTASYARNYVWRNKTSIWEDSVLKSPGKARPHINLGVAYEGEGRIDESIEEFRAASRLDPNNPTPRMNLGHKYIAKGRMEMAMQQYEGALSIDPNLIDALVGLGNIHMYFGDTDLAILKYEAAVKVNRYFPSPHIGLGRAYEVKGLTGMAIEQYEEVLRMFPNNTEARIRLNNIAAEKGESETARMDHADSEIERLEREVAQNPDDPLAHVALGNLYRAKGLYEKASEHYETAIGLRPDIVEAHFNLGLINNLLGKNKEAVENFKAVISLEPGVAAAHNNLGNAYKSIGLLDEAIEQYNAALTLNPDLAVTHNNLGEAYQAKGMSEEAEKHFRAAKSILDNK